MKPPFTSAAYPAATSAERPPRNHSWSLRVPVLIAWFACLYFSGTIPGHAAVLWKEDFEPIVDVIDRWSIDAVWGFGKPTLGPKRAHLGLNCAGTSMSGTYSSNLDSLLIRDPAFVVPDAGTYPRLRFWHWMNVSPGDTGQVEIQVAGGSWEPLSISYTTSSSAWTRPTLDLRKYAGFRVQIAFRFRSNSDAKVGNGWYIDDVECVYDPPEFDLLAQPDLMSQIGDWNVEGGVWEFGQPGGVGPGSSYSAGGCAGTILTGNYDAGVDSRLITPPFTLPESSTHPRLRFWHWFNLGAVGTGEVEIRIEDGEWRSLGAPCQKASSVWTRATLDLTGYAGRRVEIAFRVRANSTTAVAPGWYVDDVEIATGETILQLPEGFEAGQGDWHVDRGDWQIGVPPKTGPGPGKPHQGTRCAGTVLAGSYDPSLDTRLISPPVIVAPAESYPRLRLWSWHALGTGDTGVVEVREVGSESWTPASRTLTSYSRVWTPMTIDLRSFGGKRVEVAFRLHANTDTGVEAGWYIDDLEWIANGPPSWDPVHQPQDFNLGFGDWEVEGGNWQIGLPITPPDPGPLSGPCAATVLGGRYDPRADARLISPPFQVPTKEECPELRFWQWHSFATGHFGSVEVRPVNTDGWSSLPFVASRDNLRWTRVNLSLADYAGQTVQVAFHLNARSSDATALGWYLDDIEVKAECPCFTLVNRPEGFEDGLADWSIEGGTWQVGAPRSPGPPRAFLGGVCAGTGLRSNYDTNVRSRLISPLFYLPCSAASTRLRFAHWYNFGAGDSGWVELFDESQNSWTRVAGPFTGAGGDWNPSETVDLIDYVGRNIRVAFVLNANTDASTATGWFIDHVRITAQLLDPGLEFRVTESDLSRPVSFRVSPVCPDLALRLSPPSPAAARIDRELGIVTWIPEECDGPGVHPLVVSAVDPRNECVILQSVTNFVEVLETNQPPVWTQPPSIPIAATFPAQVDLKNYVFDSDCPANPLTFALGENPPSGLTLSADGKLAWTPTISQTAIVNEIRIIVSDGLRSTEGTVMAAEHTVFAVVRREGNLIRFRVEGGSPGATYLLQAVDELPIPSETSPNPAPWTTIMPFVWPNKDHYVDQIPLQSQPSRFLRILRKLE